MLKNSKKVFLDSLVIGSALFAMFFGAGNMIFPPYLGFKAGTEWFSGFLGYYIADIGLAVAAILAQTRTGGYQGMLSPFGKYAGKAMMLVMVLCIGPVISIPRTAATTFELSMLPLAPNMNMPLFYIIFFLITALLCINKSAVVDIVGKVLTPVLFIGLLVLIVKGIITPLGDITLPSRSESIVADGIEAGYQSMDVLAAVIFGVLILQSARDKGYLTERSSAKVAAGAGLVAGAGLLIIYLGLTYLGATASSLYNMHTNRTELLTSIIGGLFSGKSGTVFFGIIAGFACLSTAIALTSSAAEYFEKILKGKVGYKTFVIAICTFGAIISLVGVEGLISFASPILSIIYPPTLVLVFYSFVSKRIDVTVCRFAAYTALVFGVFEAVSSIGIGIPYLNVLPFASLGLSWVLPSAVMGAVGFAFSRLLKNKQA